MEIISPEEAAGRAEQSWLRRATDAGAGWLECGWCRFALDLRQRYGGSICEHCPVIRLFGHCCSGIPEIERWYAVSDHLMRDAAQAVYELAVKKREELVQAAYEILEEQDIEMPLQWAK